MRNAHFSRYFSMICLATLLGACGGGGGGGGGGGTTPPPPDAPLVPALTVVAAGSTGTRVAAQFFTPAGVAADAGGNVYVADTGNHTIRKINTAGLVSLLAGRAGTAGNTDATSTSARFSSPNAVAVDGSGNVYVADAGNHSIRKITPAGVVTTLAGAGTPGSGDGTGTAAGFNQPYGLAVDAGGNVYVADTGNHSIRKITPAGVVTTLAGSAGSAGSTDDTGNSARFSAPIGIAVNSAGTVYVADTGNNTLRAITPAGVVTTLAGMAGMTGDSDGTGAAAHFTGLFGVTVDAGGTLYVADSGNNRIRRVTAAGVVTTLAGTGDSGAADGTGLSASFAAPEGVASGPSGTLYVADTDNHTIRKIAVGSTTVSTYAGVSGVPGFADGAGQPARFQNPLSAVLDSSDNLFVADTDAAVIRRVTATGVRTLWIGTDGAAGYGEGGTATAQFFAPGGLALDGAGNLILADTGNHIIRRISAAPSASTLAGTPEDPGSQDGSGTSLPLAAQFSSPAAVATGNGLIYVADTDNSTIRRISSSGVVTTLAGNADEVDSIDGDCLTARFFSPQGLAIDSSGNLYVADTENNTIRKITTGCQVTTLAGDAVNNASGAVDGSGSEARFDTPLGLAVDTAGNVYVADFNNGIRRITAAGAVSTLLSLEDADGGVLPNPTSVSISGSKLVITAGNLVFLYQL